MDVLLPLLSITPFPPPYRGMGIREKRVRGGVK